MGLKLLKDGEQVKNKLSWVRNNRNKFVYVLTTDGDWQGLQSKSSWNCGQEKVNCQFI